LYIAINVMLINSHPLNANGKDALRIYIKQNELHSLRLTDIIETTIQILIIDECSRRRASRRRNTIEELQSIANVALSSFCAPHPEYASFTFDSFSYSYFP
jgi:hypothetical protein